MVDFDARDFWFLFGAKRVNSLLRSLIEKVLQQSTIHKSLIYCGLDYGILALVCWLAFFVGDLSKSHSFFVVFNCLFFVSVFVMVYRGTYRSLPHLDNYVQFIDFFLAAFSGILVTATVSYALGSPLSLKTCTFLLVCSVFGLLGLRLLIHGIRHWAVVRRSKVPIVCILDIEDFAEFGVVLGMLRKYGIPIDAYTGSHRLVGKKLASGVYLKDVSEFNINHLTKADRFVIFRGWGHRDPEISTLIKRLNRKGRITFCVDLPKCEFGGSVSSDSLFLRNVLKLKSPLYESKLHLHERHRCIMVTGAGGSIGSEIVNQLLNERVLTVIAIDNSELNLFKLEEKFGQHNRFISYLGDYGNPELVSQILGDHQPSLVFNAAAYKHVSLCEKNKQAAFENNVISLIRFFDVCNLFNVREVCQISTDKAVRPSCFMGLTKRLGELVCNDISNNTPLKMSVVRFGNVLNSSGSAIPKFISQLSMDQPITLTDRRMRRWFMTIEDAVNLVLHAASEPKHGMVQVLNMGEAIKIVDIIAQLAEFFGSRNAEDVLATVQEIGMRDGEKLEEELLVYPQNCSQQPNFYLEPIIWGGPSNIEEVVKKLIASSEFRDDLDFDLMMSELRREGVGYGR